ncbi:MAG: hypothetical protein R2806_23660 [Saprospiraceae bacterium]
MPIALADPDWLSSTQSTLNGSLATHGEMQGIVSTVNMHDTSTTKWACRFQFRIAQPGRPDRYGYYANASSPRICFMPRPGRTFLRNIGIGTSNPSEMLEVNWQSKFNGATTNGILFTDGSKLTSAANLDNDPSNELQDLTPTS